MTAPVGVLFDMDGLLVDSEPSWTIAETALMVHLGAVMTPEVKELIIGNHIAKAAQIVLDYTGSDETVEWVMQFLMERMTELFSQELPLMPGARELLDELRARDVPLALVSASYRALVDAALDDLGAYRFAATISGDEVRNPKPDPEAYLRAAAAIGVPPERCIVFEDSASGVAAGESAGCTVVAVPTFPGMVAGPRRYVVASLVGLDADWLLSLPDRSLSATATEGHSKTR
jgi:HAD superfamily hydrolase (TIGR01509 family)